MDLNGQTIRHRAFGSGVITKLAAGTVTVSFAGEEKKFIYPDAFKDFLVMDDKSLQKYVADQIAKRDAALVEQRRAEQEEYQRRQKLENFTIAANSHAVFDIDAQEAATVCKKFTVSTGHYISGYSKGKPRIADRMKPNSACVLTVRPQGGPEQERAIVGAFMVKDDFFGEDAGDGIIEAHPEFRMLVPQGQQLLFWDYFGHDSQPRWGNTAFKYCSGSVMSRLLAEMTNMLSGGKEWDGAMKFYRYFCKMNRLNPLVEEAEDSGAEVL